MNKLATVFVIDAQRFVMMCRTLDKDCVYPAYRFDNEYQAARSACEDIAIMKNKLVMNAMYDEFNPLIYKPIGGEIESEVEDYRSRLKGIIA